MLNDFTKEELSIILLWAIDRVESIGFEEFKSEGHHLVYEKIQSMIENYCDHEHLNRVYSCIDCGVSQYTCNKCARITYEGLE